MGKVAWGLHSQAFDMQGLLLEDVGVAHVALVVAGKMVLQVPPGA